jgi:uncharacterized DUF497 family protein
MPFEWDEEKNEANKRKHQVSFEAATFVFGDPLALSLIDRRYDDERWVTLGRSGNRILYVAHLVYEDEDEEIIRIISAREATAHERRRYLSNE